MKTISVIIGRGKYYLLILPFTLALLLGNEARGEYFQGDRLTTGADNGGRYYAGDLGQRQEAQEIEIERKGTADTQPQRYTYRDEDGNTVEVEVCTYENGDTVMRSTTLNGANEENACEFNYNGERVKFVRSDEAKKAGIQAAKGVGTPHEGKGLNKDEVKTVKVDKVLLEEMARVPLKDFNPEELRKALDAVSNIQEAEEEKVEKNVKSYYDRLEGELISKAETMSAAGITVEKLVKEITEGGAGEEGRRALIDEAVESVSVSTSNDDARAFMIFREKAQKELDDALDDTAEESLKKIEDMLYPFLEDMISNPESFIFFRNGKKIDSVIKLPMKGPRTVR